MSAYNLGSVSCDALAVSEAHEHFWRLLTMMVLPWQAATDAEGVSALLCGASHPDILRAVLRESVGWHPLLHVCSGICRHGDDLPLLPTPPTQPFPPQIMCWFVGAASMPYPLRNCRWNPCLR